jgi:signal transduction histidine kinase
MTSKYALVLFLFWVSLLNAQNNNTDSLVQALHTMPEDTNKIFTYQAIAQQYLTTQLDSSLVYAEQGLLLAKKLDFYKGIVRCLNVAGNYHERKTKYDLALEYYEEALVLCEQHDYTKGFAIVLNNIAIIHTRTGAHEKALKLYFEALKAEEKDNNQKGIAQAYNNIGIVYYYQQNIDKTLEYFEKSIAIEEAIGDFETLKKGYNNIGALYDYQKKYNKALLYYRKSYVIGKQYNDKMEMSINLNNIAVAHYRLKNLDSAVIYQNQSIELREELGDNRGAAYSYHNFADVSKDQGNPKEAEKFYLKSLSLSKEKKLKEIEMETYKSLAKLWSEQEQFEKANEYLNLHINAKDSLINEQSSKALAEAESKYEVAKKEKALLVQQTQIDKQNIALNQKNIQLLSLGSIAVILILIGILIFNYLRQRNLQLKKEHQLKEAMGKLETQKKLEKQRYQISRDLHDNIGAQLTFIISSIDNLKYGFQLEKALSSKLKKITNFTSNTIRDLRDTIWAMNKDAISFSDLKQRIHTFLVAAKDASQQTEFNFIINDNLPKEYTLSSVEGMNIYRIIQEALNNALKYAEAEKIEISVNKIDSALYFKVIDDGKGFDLDSAVLSNGLHNMRKRANEMGADLEIKSQVNHGTFVSLKHVVR